MTKLNNAKYEARLLSVKLEKIEKQIDWHKNTDQPNAEQMSDVVSQYENTFDEILKIEKKIISIVGYDHFMQWSNAVYN